MRTRRAGACCSPRLRWPPPQRDARARGRSARDAHPRLWLRGRRCDRREKERREFKEAQELEGLKYAPS
jgi:hypothetical protein